MECGLLQGEIDGGIPCTCDDSAENCQRNYEDYEVFQRIGLLKFSHCGSY